MKLASNSLFVVGRVLLGLYFILPGIMKITGFAGTAEYMAAHGMVFVSVFLVLAIIAEVGGGLALAAGFHTKWVALSLAALVIVINVVLHDFWSMEAGIQKSHELQNFIKNTAIMAGLLVLAGSSKEQGLT